MLQKRNFLILVFDGHTWIVRNGTTTLFSLSSLLSSIFEIFTDFGDSDFWNSHPDWQAAIGSDLSLTLSKESSQPKTIWINGYNTTLSYFLKRNPPRLSNRCPTKSRVIFMVLNSRMKKKKLTMFAVCHWFTFSLVFRLGNSVDEEEESAPAFTIVDPILKKVKRR